MFLNLLKMLYLFKALLKQLFEVIKIITHLKCIRNIKNPTIINLKNLIFYNIIY